MFGALTLMVSLLAAPVQITFSMPMVRVGETAPIQVQWMAEIPTGARLQWTCSVGEVRETDPGTYAFAPSDTPGRAFVHLSVVTPSGVWAESAAPVLVYRQFVILKADDLVHVPDEGWTRWVTYMDEMVVHRAVKVAAGAIGNRMSQPTEEIRARVKAWQATDLLELFNHGYDHASYPPPPDKATLPAGTTYEFQGRPYEEQLDHLQRTQQIIRDNYGVQMRSFGAPFNKWDENTVQALHALGQIDIWMFGSAKSECFNLPRGGGEIEDANGVPSLAEYLSTHDPARQVVLLQHHPYLAPFWDGWSDFKTIIDRIGEDGGTFILPAEYVELIRNGTLPLEPNRFFPDAALECAARMALGKWQDALGKDDAAALTRLEWADRLPRIRSLAGLEQCTALRELDLRDNNLPDIGPVLSLWQATGADMTVHWEGNPVTESFNCGTVPHYEAQGLRLHVTGPCDNILLTLGVEGQGSLDPAPGEHTLPRGYVASLRARPAQGWKLDHWEGLPEASANERLSVELPDCKTIVARFVELPPVVVEGEGEAHNEGEGEAHSEGEGEAHNEGEGEAHGEGEGEAPYEGEAHEGEPVDTGSGCQGSCPPEGSGPVRWLEELACFLAALLGATAYTFRR